MARKTHPKNKTISHIHTVLTKVLREYQADCSGSINFRYDGLCSCALYLTNTTSRSNPLTQEEYQEFMEYLRKNQPRLRRHFYMKTRLHQYIWTPGMCRPRLAWLNEHIRLNS